MGMAVRTQWMLLNLSWFWFLVLFFVMFSKSGGVSEPLLTVSTQKVCTLMGELVVNELAPVCKCFSTVCTLMLCLSLACGVFCLLVVLEPSFGNVLCSAVHTEILQVVLDSDVVIELSS